MIIIQLFLYIFKFPNLNLYLQHKFIYNCLMGANCSCCDNLTAKNDATKANSAERREGMENLPIVQLPDSDGLVLNTQNQMEVISASPRANIRACAYNQPGGARVYFQNNWDINNISNKSFSAIYNFKHYRDPDTEQEKYYQPQYFRLNMPLKSEKCVIRKGTKKIFHVKNNLFDDLKLQSINYDSLEVALCNCHFIVKSLSEPKITDMSKVNVSEGSLYNPETKVIVDNVVGGVSSNFNPISLAGLQLCVADWANTHIWDGKDARNPNNQAYYNKNTDDQIMNNLYLPHGVPIRIDDSKWRSVPVIYENPKIALQQGLKLKIKDSIIFQISNNSENDLGIDFVLNFGLNANNIGSEWVGNNGGNNEKLKIEFNNFDDSNLELLDEIILGKVEIPAVVMPDPLVPKPVNPINPNLRS